MFDGDDAAVVVLAVPVAVILSPKETLFIHIPIIITPLQKRCSMRCYVTAT